MSRPAHHGISYADYLRLERQTDVRHEFLDGEAWAMAGGTPRHSKIKANLIRVIGNALVGAPCQSYDSDLKVRILETGLATYPDATVICGPLVTHPEDRNAVTNPSMLVEVLSDSTERWDRKGKFSHYRRAETLRHYVLVDSEIPGVEHYALQGDGSWKLTFLEPGDHIVAADLGLRIAVDDLYLALPEVTPEDRLIRGQA